MATEECYNCGNLPGLVEHCTLCKETGRIPERVKQSSYVPPGLKISQPNEVIEDTDA